MCERRVQIVVPESNITGKNNGLIDEEPWLMYIYRQGLPGR
jgi:hypothetical protein